MPKYLKFKRNKFQAYISDYIINRENLYCLFVLVDCRHEPQKIDMEFIEWLGEKQIPFALVFTKTDKLGKNKLASNIADYKKTTSGNLGRTSSNFHELGRNRPWEGRNSQFHSTNRPQP